MGIRHGSGGRFPTRAHVILNRFDIPDEALLGRGSESRVYAMDKEHVLRIYHDTIPWAYAEDRRAFYAELAKHPLPFAVPHIYTVGSWVGHVYTVERRMPGRDFVTVLPTLQGEERKRALTSFLEVAAQIGAVQFPEKPYGELIAKPHLLRDSWQAYLAASMERALATSRADLREDLPKAEEILDAIFAQLSLVGDAPPKSLVHGDYFPANVFIDDDLRVCGVGDFSYATIVGDARMDIAGAVWMLGAMKDACLEDSIFLRDLVGQRWGAEMLAVVDFYRLYYSVYFSGCKADDPTTYWWCVDNLRTVNV